MENGNKTKAINPGVNKHEKYICRKIRKNKNRQNLYNDIIHFNKNKLKTTKTNEKNQIPTMEELKKEKIINALLENTEKIINQRRQKQKIENEKLREQLKSKIKSYSNNRLTNTAVKYKNLKTMNHIYSKALLNEV